MKIAQNTGTEKIFTLIKNNDISTIINFLQTTPSYNINQVDEYSKDTALNIAVRNNNLEIVKLLLSYNPALGRIVIRNIGTKENEFDYLYANLPLEIACKQNNMEMIKLLIENGAVVYNPDDHSPKIQLLLESAAIGKKVSTLSSLSTEESQYIPEIVDNPVFYETLVNSFNNYLNSSKFFEHNNITSFKEALSTRYSDEFPLEIINKLLGSIENIDELNHSNEL